VGRFAADFKGTSGQLLESAKRRRKLIFSLVSLFGGGVVDFEHSCDAFRASIAGMRRRVVLQTAGKFCRIFRQVRVA
jgi:hypothetical protein